MHYDMLNISSVIGMRSRKRVSNKPSRIIKVTSHCNCRECGDSKTGGKLILCDTPATFLIVHWLIRSFMGRGEGQSNFLTRRLDWKVAAYPGYNVEGKGKLETVIIMRSARSRIKPLGQHCCKTGALNTFLHY